jgi:hypothetical protein
MAGVTGGLDPSGDLNPGNLSINGQRESSNGFLVNGIDVQEHMNGGTSIIPNLDSIEEFRVLTNNFDPEYGNYNGGMVTVVSKQGSNAFHGNAFEFFRNTGWMRGATSIRPDRHSAEPVWRHDRRAGKARQDLLLRRLPGNSHESRRFNRQYLCADRRSAERQLQRPYRVGQRPLPRIAAHAETGLHGHLGRSLHQRLPRRNIPQDAWSAPGKNLLQYIPSPNVSASQYSTSAFAQTVRDDKGSARIDGTAGWASSRPITSSMTITSTIPIQAPLPGPASRVSMRCLSAARNCFRWAITS